MTASITPITSTTRPKVWRGVDAQDFHNGECPIDWQLIDSLQIEEGLDRYDLYSMFMNWATHARDIEEDLELCSYFACQGITALNYAL